MSLNASNKNNGVGACLPRILFEAHPLTLKKGTGIYVYALNLLRGIDSIADNRAGLLLLLDEPLNIPMTGFFA
jgi:hypothetical protein